VTLRRYLFRRNRRGKVEVCLTDDEAALLLSLRDELEPVLNAPPAATDDPVVRRLFPVAYTDPTEEDAEAQWQRLMHDDLARQRLVALADVAQTIEGARRGKGTVEFELGDDGVAAWLSALNDARLALGTRLDVTEDMDYDLEGRDPDDPLTQAYAVYLWLGWAQELLLETIA